MKINYEWEKVVLASDMNLKSYDDIDKIPSTII
jgi:hypothetical protein